MTACQQAGGERQTTRDVEDALWIGWHDAAIPVHSTFGSCLGKHISCKVARENKQGSCAGSTPH